MNVKQYLFFYCSQMKKTMNAVKINKSTQYLKT
jgi:hypothetical protein